MVKEITTTFNWTTSTVDSRCCLTNFEMLVSHSMSALLRQSV